MTNILDKQLNGPVMVLKQRRDSSTLALSPEEGLHQSVPGSHARSENWRDHQVAKSYHQILSVLRHHLPFTQDPLIIPGQGLEGCYPETERTWLSRKWEDSVH